MWGVQQMMLIYLLCAVCGVVVFVVASKASLPLRWGLSIGAFVLLAAAATAIRSRIGDRAAPDAVTVDQKQLQGDGTKPKQ
jgi:hypothetical protein